MNVEDILGRKKAMSEVKRSFDGLDTLLYHFASELHKKDTHYLDQVNEWRSLILVSPEYLRICNETKILYTKNGYIKTNGKNHS